MSSPENSSRTLSGFEPVKSGSAHVVAEPGKSPTQMDSTSSVGEGSSCGDAPVVAGEDVIAPAAMPGENGNDSVSPDEELLRYLLSIC